jgi:hypothetical protein
MTVINHMFTENPLEKVVSQFEHWRATRCKRGPIPDELRALIKPLETQYSPNKIVKALRINHAQLKSCFSSFNNKPASQPMTLIECLTHTALPTPSPQGATLTFSCRNGRPVTLNGLASNDIAAAITSLVRG